jgi:hypothetical protein
VTAFAQARAPRRQLSVDDLAWFFGLGQTAFERSTTGPMLERAKLYASAGERVWNGEQFDVVESGLIRFAEISARPTAELHAPGGYEPSLTDLERYARVSRALMLVERASRVHAQALEYYYGDLGEGWAKTKRGRLGSVYHLVPAGLRVLELAEEKIAETARKARKAAAKKKAVAWDAEADARREQRDKDAAHHLTVAERMWSLVTTADRQARWRDGLVRTDREAEELYRASCEDWGSVAARER